MNYHPFRAFSALGKISANSTQIVPHDKLCIDINFKDDNKKMDL